MKKAALTSLAVLMIASIACVMVHKRAEVVPLMASLPEIHPTVDHDSQADEADSIPTFEETVGSMSARHSPDTPDFLKPPPPSFPADTLSIQKRLQIPAADMHLQQAPAPYNPYLDPFFAGTWIDGPCVRKPRLPCARPRAELCNRRQRQGREFRSRSRSQGRSLSRSRNENLSGDRDDEFIPREPIGGGGGQACGRGACRRDNAKLATNDMPNPIGKAGIPLQIQRPPLLPKDGKKQVESDEEYGNEEDEDDFSADEDDFFFMGNITAGSRQQNVQAKKLVKKDTLIATQPIKSMADRSSPKPIKQQVGNNYSVGLRPLQASVEKRAEQEALLVSDDNDENEQLDRDLCR